MVELARSEIGRGSIIYDFHRCSIRDSNAQWREFAWTTRNPENRANIVFISGYL